MRRYRFIACLLALSLAGHHATAAQPIATDSRIKTFVYNANEVFSVTTEYGYQSNIEFGENEAIDTVSVGDRVGWQIIPANRRLFIRAMEENAHTNMTVITNKRAYQFDLKSSSASNVIGSEQLVYVVRFYYPGESEGPAPGNFGSLSAPPPLPASVPMGFGAPTPTISYAPASPISYVPTPSPMMAPAATAPVGYAPYTAPAPAAPNANANFRYTYSGASSMAPVKIYDDGRTTYFKFRGAIPGTISVISARGDELSVPARTVAMDTVAVDVVAPRFSLRGNGQQVIVYNESNGA